MHETTCLQFNSTTPNLSYTQYLDHFRFLSLSNIDRPRKSGHSISGTHTSYTRLAAGRHWLGNNAYWLLRAKFPRRLRRGSSMSSIFRGSVIWITWLDRNAMCFNQAPWTDRKLEETLWSFHKSTPDWRPQTLRALPETRRKCFWGGSITCGYTQRFFGSRNHLEISWNLTIPKIGVFT